MEGYKKKRDAVEWVTPIVKVILNHGNHTSLDTLYDEIPKYMYPPLTEYEWRPSGKAGEWEWRGTLRGYLSDLVKDGTLKKDIGSRRKPWFIVILPEEWNFLLE